MPAACVDAVVTDPPAGMSFMGKEWDDFRRARNPADTGRDNVFGRTSARGPEYGRRDRDNFIAFLTAILAECYRVTKPGGRMLCWSIPRTMHWTGTAIEDAGWEIENTIAHVLGSGFPKAKTQLKPAREDWWIARKPAKNVLPLNIDECRVATRDNLNGGAHGGRDILPSDEREGASLVELAPGHTTGREFVQPSGRWPANLALSHFAGCVRVGSKAAGTGARHVHAEDHTSAGAHDGYVRPGASAYTHKIAGQVRSFGQESVEDWRCVAGCTVAELDRQSGGDGGGASRFFNTFEADRDDTDTALFVYQAKASRADRNAGDAANTHPTVKSTPLCRHLVKLIAKPGDVVLDAFCGSGSTGRGALLEGCRFIGIEREDTEKEPYVTIARRRIADAERTTDKASATLRPDSQVSLSL